MRPLISITTYKFHDSYLVDIKSRISNRNMTTDYRFLNAKKISPQNEVSLQIIQNFT